MVKKIINGFDFRAEESLIVGYLVYFFLFWTPKVYYIPLFDFIPQTMQAIVLPSLGLVSIMGFILVKKWRFFFLCMVSLVLFLDLNKYSSMFAFRYFPAIVSMAYLFLYNLKEDQKKLGASLILGCIFLFSAIHKVNLNYLRGSEFYNGGNFLIVFYQHFPNLVIPWGHWIGKALALVSIVVEFGIAFFMFRRPSIGIHLVIFFLLFLALFNSGVLYVYFFFLPLVLLIKKYWGQSIKQIRFEKWFNNPLVLGILFWFCHNYDSSIVKEFLTNTLWVVVLIALHAKVFFAEFKNDLFLDARKVSFSYKLLIVPSILFVLFVGSYFFIPSPYGFKMFSAKRFRTPSHVLVINASNSCYILDKEIRFSPIVDAKIEFFNYGGCAIYFPTISGLKGVIREVCLQDKRTQMILDNRAVNCL